MWRVLLLFLLCIWFSSPAAQIVLNEVYYDHPGADDGFEFVELYNGSAAAASLAGWSMETSRDGSWKTVWTGVAGDSIAAYGVFVAGGQNVVPRPDASLSSSLQNGPDAIRLSSGGAVVDLLGYGGLTDPALYETESAADVDDGRSLGRDPDGFDTDDNARDFTALEPSPGLRNRPVHDVALAERGTSVVLPVGREGTIHLVLSNHGIEAVAAGAVSVALSDTTGHVRGVADNPSPIAPAGKWEAEFEVVLGAGYHAFVAMLFYAPDERATNNVLNFSRRAGDIPVIISEIMSEPGDGCPEYVELHNAGGVPYDLAGYRIRDRVSAPSALTSTSRVLAPGGYVALTGDGDALRRCFPNLGQDAVLELQGAWPSLNHTGGDAADSLVVIDGIGAIVERVDYPPQPPGAAGRSLERADMFAGVRRHTWVLSGSAEGGTPGRANTREIKRPPVRLSVEPTVLAPSAGEMMLINVAAARAPTRAHVKVFDTSGRQVADLGSSAQLPFVFAWDGRDRGGRPMIPGIYVLSCEWVPLGAGGVGGVRVERVVVGCVEGKR